MNPDEVLKSLLEKRQDKEMLRRLGHPQNDWIDFCSNDYLGLAKNSALSTAIASNFKHWKGPKNGSGSARLIRSNTPYIEALEQELADFCSAEAALIYNSGYTANLGFFSTVPQRGDVVLYDAFIHASIRAGLQMGKAKSYAFRHNDVIHLEERIQSFKGKGRLFVVVESVYSMDGDSPDLKAIAELCRCHDCNLVVDEAHAFGLFGAGEGRIGELGLVDSVYARIVTFGKALGVTGAAVIGSAVLKAYQINFSSPFIYTTLLSPHDIVAVKTAFDWMKKLHEDGEVSSTLLDYFQAQKANIDLEWIDSESWIHCAIVSGNAEAKKLEKVMHENGLDVKAILSPTVPEGKERIRICFHAFNTKEEVQKLIKNLKNYAQ